MNIDVRDPKKVIINKKELFIWITISAVILIVSNIIIFSIFSDPVFIITADDSETFSVFDDTITFVVDNDLSSQSKVVNVYGFNGPTSIDISTSNIVEGDQGEMITLTFTPNHIDALGSTPKQFSVSLSPLKGGLYHGAIFVSDGINNSPVPIVVDVKPQVPLFVILVIDGIALSIAAWSFIKFLDKRYKIVIRNAMINGWFAKGNLTGEMKKEPLSIQEYLEAKMVTKEVMYENAILNIGTVIFGMTIAMFALVDNTFISGIHNLGLPEIFFLIGIGLGIGSLKEFIADLKENNPNPPPQPGIDRRY